MTRGGKSTLMNCIMDRYFKSQICILMTESPNADIYKEGFFKSKDVVKCPDFMPQIIKECYTINKNTNNKYPFCFVMDDLVGHRSDKQLKKLHTIYRNSSMSCLISGQTMSILDTTSRANTNFILLGKLGNDAIIEDVIKAFLTSYYPSSWKMVDKIKQYKEDTKNYCFYMIDNIKGETFLTKCKI
jgi:hypothetical protein